MAEQAAYGKAFRDSLKGSHVKIVGLVAGAGSLVTLAAAETFNFSILTDLTTALIALMPDLTSLVNEGGPLVINFCIVAAVCAPFIWLAKKAGVF
jgi:hypothetical protein